MPSERRLHPSTLLFDLVKHVKQFALPSVLVIFGVAQSSGGPGGMFGRLPSGWEMWLLVLFLPATLLSLTRYLTFRLRYDDRELVIRTGLFFRNERHIPFSRIQNVDATQNVMHRLFGVADVRVETGGGQEEEARLSVLPHAAFLEMREHVFRERSTAPLAPEAPQAPQSPAVLLHLPLRELLLFGFLENKGMVFIGAALGVAMEMGLLGGVTDRFFDRGFFRSLVRPFVTDGPFPFERLGIGIAGFLVFLVLVRLISMLWAFVRLYDFRLTRVGEDLRSEYGLFTRVAATVPIRRVQVITIEAGPLHRWLDRASVKVATAGGAGRKEESAANVREWMAPLIRVPALEPLLRQVLPGFDLAAVDWQPVHPRAFARAIKPVLAAAAIVSLIASAVIGWSALGLLIVMLASGAIATRQHVAHLGWAEGEEVVMMRSGWLWRQITLARVNKIQAVAMHQTPFDRRASMARVRVDTAGAGGLSHRVDIPYLDHELARVVAQRLAAAAANTTFRW